MRFEKKNDKSFIKMIIDFETYIENYNSGNEETNEDDYEL